MKNNQCYLCSGENHKKREGKIRNLNDVEVLECEDCSLVFLSSFDHIDGEFYKSGMMHTGASIEKWQEITLRDDVRRFKLLKRKIKGKKILDFGSGNAGFLLRAKNVADKAVGLELDDTVKPYYTDHGITFVPDLDSVKEKYDFITMFHVLEHLPNPKEVLEQLATKLAPGGKLIIEVPNSEDALITVFKNKGFLNFTYWGCHLFLFNEKTLRKLFENSLYKINRIKHVQRYGIANHLHWLIKNQPNGHNIWKFLDIKPFNKIYEKALALFGLTDTVVVSVSLK